MKDESNIRDNILSIPSFLALNSYTREVERDVKSNSDVKVIIYQPVERKPLPNYLGNKIDFLV